MGNDKYDSKKMKRACIMPPAGESDSFSEYIRAIRVDRGSVNFPTVPADERLTVRPGRERLVEECKSCGECVSHPGNEDGLCYECYVEIESRP